MNGADLKTAQIISGHKTSSQLMHYAHVFSPHVQNAMAVLNREIATITLELHTSSGEAEADDDNVRAISG